MATEPMKVVEGWTGRLVFTLTFLGVTVDLTGCTVALRLRTAAGALVTITGTVAADADQVTNKGKVNYDPASTDLVVAQNAASTTPSTLHKAHFKVTDGTGDIVYFPHDDDFEILVYRA